MKKILPILLCVILAASLSLTLISCNKSDTKEVITPYTDKNFEYSVVKVYKADADESAEPLETYATVTKFIGDTVAVAIPSTISDNIQVKKVAGLVFEHSAIQSVVIGEGITAIEPFAFGYADSLRTVSIPSTAETIGDYAFVECKELRSVTIYAKTPPKVEKYSFKIYNANSKAEDQYEISKLLQIEIRGGSDKDAYIAANKGWSEYKDALIG